MTANLLLGFFITTALFGQSGTDHRSGLQGAVLSGEFKGIGDSSFVLFVTETPVQGIKPDKTIHSTVVREGKFCFRFELTSLSYILFSRESLNIEVNFGGESSVYLEPGDSLHMIIPMIQDLRASDVSFSGMHAERQFLLKELGQVYKNHALNTREKAFEKSVVASIELNEKVTARLIALEGSVSSEFWNEIYADRKEAFYGSMVSYFLGSRRAEESERRALYSQYRSRIMTDERDAITTIARHGSVRTLMNLALLDHLVKNELPLDHALVRDVRTTYQIMFNAYREHPELESMLARFVLHVASYTGWTDDVAYAASHFLRHFSGSNYRELVLEMKEKFASTLNEPFSYNFTLSDTLGRKVSLADFAGKILFVDVMFTGCVGCYFARPRIEELEAEFGGEDIAFVSISVDKTLERFKAGIGRFSSSKSIPLYTGGMGMEHPIIRHFQIIAYPTIILIGRDGDILTRRTNLRNPQGEKDLRHLLYEALLQ